MAEILGFRGVRYSSQENASKVLAPPYDVIDAEHRARLAALDPHNCVALDLPLDSSGKESEERYPHAGNLYREWLKNGTLKRDAEPSVYRYNQVFTSDELEGRTVTRRGFIAAARLHRFDEGIVLPHERTLKGPKIDRLNLMRATSAHLSQIFTLYSDPERAVDGLFAAAEAAPPDMDGTTEDGTQHLLWRVSDPATISKISGLLAPKKLYIADGHHRYETMLTYRDERLQDDPQAPHNSTLRYGSVFLANIHDPGLVVFPTHRLIHSVKDFSSEALLQACAEWFEVIPLGQTPRDAKSLRTELAKSAAIRPSIIALAQGGLPTLLRLRGDKDVMTSGVTPDRSVARLDVTLLHGLILERILRIDRAAQEAQSNIEYFKDTGKALTALEKGKGQVLFLMSPTRVEQVQEVSDAAQIMPQKSTFFYPKIASGIVFYPVIPNEVL